MVREVRVLFYFLTFASIFQCFHGELVFYLWLKNYKLKKKVCKIKDTPRSGHPTSLAGPQQAGWVAGSRGGG